MTIKMEKWLVVDKEGIFNVIHSSDIAYEEEFLTPSNGFVGQTRVKLLDSYEIELDREHILALGIK